MKRAHGGGTMGAIVAGTQSSQSSSSKKQHPFIQPDWHMKCPCFPRGTGFYSTRTPCGQGVPQKDWWVKVSCKVGCKNQWSEMKGRRVNYFTCNMWVPWLLILNSNWVTLKQEVSVLIFFGVKQTAHETRMCHVKGNVLNPKGKVLPLFNEIKEFRCTSFRVWNLFLDILDSRVSQVMWRSGQSQWVLLNGVDGI